MQPSSRSIGSGEHTAWFEDDDGDVFYDDEAHRRADEHFAAVEAHNREVLRRVPPTVRREFAVYMRTGAIPTPLGAPRAVPRPRGAGRPAVRGSSRRSSARSGDSGDDGPGEPPRGRRLNSRKEIDAWLAERDCVLTALIQAGGLGRRQLSLDESEAA